MTRNCCYCRYFSDSVRLWGSDFKGRGGGECRRHAPDLHDNDPRWPLVNNLDWCGDYEFGKKNHPGDGRAI